MDLNLFAPGITATFDEETLVLRIDREQATPLISVLLHSKFSEGPRIEFLDNPYVNALLEALMAANQSADYMARREGMAEALASTVAFVEDWAKERSVQPDDAKMVLQRAIYPYSLT